MRQQLGQRPKQMKENGVLNCGHGRGKCLEWGGWL